MGVATADKPIAPPVRKPELPPGPDWSLPRMTWEWWKRPLPMLEQCQARYGDMFTIRLPYEGTWVFVSNPEAIKQVFTGDPTCSTRVRPTSSCCRCSASTPCCCSTSPSTWLSAS